MPDVLRLEVDRTSLTVGESLRGVVQAVADHAEVRKLTVFAECEGANISPQRWGEVELSTGPLVAGQQWSFEVTLPPHAPFTFDDDGHDLQWHVVAHGDISWIKAEVSKLPLQVQAKALALDAPALAELAALPAPDKTELGIVGKALLGLLGIAFVVSVSPLAPFLLLFLANQRIQHTRLTDFALHLPDRGLALGEWVPVTLKFRLKRPVDVASLTLTIDGTKRWRSGDNSRSHCFHEQVFTLLDDCILAPQETAAAAKQGGVYRSRTKAAGDPGVFEWVVPVQLPEDGWPRVENRITYHARAVMKVRGWPDPTASVELPVVGAVVPTGDEPAAPSVEETSPGVAIVAVGDDPPPGVDITVAADRIWPWVAMPTLGAAITVVGVGMALTTPNAPWALILPVIALGLVGTAYGLWGFYVRLYR